MKLLLDENVHRGLYRFLSDLGHDVKLPPKSSSNSIVLNIAIKEERILITRDMDFLSPKYSSLNHFGIIVIRINPRDLEKQKEALLELLKNLPEEIRGKTFLLK